MLGGSHTPRMGRSLPHRPSPQIARVGGVAPSWQVKADRLHPLIPRETLRSKGLYRRRGSVERAFGRLKNESALAPLRVRGIERVRLHANLTILAKLSCALASQREILVAA